MSSLASKKSFTFSWTLENVSFMNEDETVRSPSFVVSPTHDLKCYISYRHKQFYLNNSNFFGLKSDVGTKIDCEFAILSENGLVLASYKREKFSSSIILLNNKEIDKNCVFNNSLFFPDDKLTARCKIWISEEEMIKDTHCFARSRICIKKDNFQWNIPNFISLESDKNCVYQLKSVSDDTVQLSFNLFLKNPYTDEESLSIRIAAENNKIQKLKFLLIALSDLCKSNKVITREFKFPASDKFKLLTLPFSRNDILANKNQYLLKNTLSFYCECSFSTGDVVHEIEREVYDCSSFAISQPANYCISEKNSELASKHILYQNVKSLFQDGILSDVKLKANGNEFQAHKNILSVRSPVFKAMFQNDMKEKLTECIEIEDLDGDTVDKLLQYVYTAEIKDLRWETACKLYNAADKYEILALRDECSTYLKSNLSLHNACKVLILSDAHQDEDLKSAVQDFIFDYDIMNSDEWGKLMATHLKLASDTMYHQIRRQRFGALNFPRLSSNISVPATLFNNGSIGDFNGRYTTQTSSFKFTPSNFEPGNLNFGGTTSENSLFFSAPASAPRKLRKPIKKTPR